MNHVIQLLKNMYEFVKSNPKTRIDKEDKCNANRHFNYVNNQCSLKFFSVVCISSLIMYLFCFSSKMLLHQLISTLLFINTIHAYITDIKLVTCNSTHACPSYPGYRQIPTDLNQGIQDAPSIFLHMKQDPKEDPITDLMILFDNQTVPDISKWSKLDVDLNQIEKEHTSLWLYYTKDKSVSKNPVTSIIVKEGTSPLVGAEYRRIPVDLNKDLGGFHLYMYYSQNGPKGKKIDYMKRGKMELIDSSFFSSKDPISAITAKECFTSNCYIDVSSRIF